MYQETKMSEKKSVMPKIIGILALFAFIILLENIRGIFPGLPMIFDPMSPLFTVLTDHCFRTAEFQIGSHFPGYCQIGIFVMIGDQKKMFHR